MALVDKIIDAIKDIENYRFDKEVAELFDMDNKALATYKSRGELPQYYIKFFCKRYGVELKNIDTFLGNIDKYNKNIIGNKQSGSVKHKGKEKKMDYIVEAQQETIKLQKEKIEQLEKIIKVQKDKIVKPAYHFKVIGKYIQKTDTWHDAQIFGDISMLGFSHDEANDILSVENNNPNSWIERYHPDSYKKLHESEYWKKTKSNFHLCSWEHMMWRSKSGQYVCLNINMMYDRKEETVTTLFYYVNGDNE